MPPQPGVFSVPYGMGHKSRSNTYNADGEMGVAYAHHSHAPVAGPSSRMHEEGKKENRRKDLSGELGKEMNDRREDHRSNYNEGIAALHGTAIQLSTRPDTNSMYNTQFHSSGLHSSQHSNSRRSTQESVLRWRSWRSRKAVAYAPSTGLQ
ncbi:hypothetical protein DFP72DRAFT_436982 [Ephemerocybe angulata]|uniref:Uncharacterized protein n=1 Tax=Ephemerocybe angulata TaxID=980116 RepID=A0A8H6HUN3_9AGAR|nr:hypothetical protein DFP72DRAFT_436982 [Tulosesus angulatus]